jgi:AraC family transcriptional regulator of adaptative response / DNA-3-methyladenine glycosylase II
VSVRIILGQQVSVAGATTLAGRLVLELGTPVRGLGPLSLTHVFPPAARIAECSAGRLQRIGLPAVRAESVRAFARAYAAEEIRIAPGCDLAELTGRLEGLPGIGAWTAQMIALRAASHPDAFPSGDLGLRKAAARLAGDGARAMDARQLEEMSQAWQPHRALAAMHLWASLGSAA